MSDFLFQINSKGYLISRESFDLEYKQAFHFGDSLAEYVRTMVGMANNRGGKIIFGIKNSPRVPIGLTNNKFQEVDPNKINQFVHEYFSHDFEWEIKNLEFDSKDFGQIIINEKQEKPIICSKAYKDILREGAIYYRYRGETKEIKYPELSLLLENEKKKERNLWMSHIDKISQIGPQNIHLLDIFKGEIHLGDEKVLIDQSLLDKIKFIKEGEFVEKNGAPTLTLAGTISGILDGNSIMPTEKAYPYRSTHIEKKFNLNSYQVRCLIWKLKIKDKPKYHDPVQTGKHSVTHKYSDALIQLIETTLSQNPDYIEKTCKEFQIDQKNKK